MVIGYIRPQLSETSKGSFGLEKAETPKDCSQGKTNMNSSLKPSKWNEYMFESGKLITYITLTYSLPICLPIYVSSGGQKDHEVNMPSFKKGIKKRKL